MYVVAAERLLPRLLTVMVELVEVAVNLYQTLYVVRAVAPPQAPAGKALTAFCILGCVAGFEHVDDGVSVAAVAQDACANKCSFIKLIKETSSSIRRLKVFIAWILVGFRQYQGLKIFVNVCISNRKTTAE